MKRYKLEDKMHNLDSDETTSLLGNKVLVRKYLNNTTSDDTNVNGHCMFKDHNDLSSLSDSVASPTLSTPTVISFNRQDVQSPLSHHTGGMSSDE